MPEIPRFDKPPAGLAKPRPTRPAACGGDNPAGSRRHRPLPPAEGARLEPELFPQDREIQIGVYKLGPLADFDLVAQFVAH